MASRQPDPLMVPAPRIGGDNAACLAEAHDAFELAAAAVGGVITRTYSIAGLTVKLEFAGPHLLETLSAAFEHHPRPVREQKTLTVFIWDSASTGVPLPPIPQDAIDGGTTGAGRVGEPPGTRAKYRPEQGSLTVLDRATGRGVFAVVDGAVLPYWVMGAPLRLILHWWMADQGRQLVHAAAVGTASGGVLLVGRGGVGKSSSALACLASRLGYAGDDYCLITVDSPPWAHSLYSSAKLSPEQARRFPELASALINGDNLETEKALFLVHRRYPTDIQHQFPIRAIVIPVISGADSPQLEPASAATALRSLAPSTIFQLPGAGLGAFTTMTRLVRQVPSYTLRLGGDLESLPGVLERAVTGLPAS